MNQSQVNVGASLGLTYQQLKACGATDKQIEDIPPTVRPVANAAGHAAQAHANVHVAAAPIAHPPQPQILMAQPAAQPALQHVGVGLPVHVGGAAFRLTTMPLWAYVLVGMFSAFFIWFAAAGWTRPAGESVITPPTVSAPAVAAATPQVIKIDPIKITVDVTGVQPVKP